LKIRTTKKKGSKFGIVPIEVAEAGLTGSALRVYIILAAYGYSVSQKAYPSVGTIACHLGITDTSVKRGLAELIERGLIANRGIHPETGTVVYTLLDADNLGKKDCKQPRRGRPLKMETSDASVNKHRTSVQ
jgi:DNA-binding MarR family transcriptional regulator